MNKAQCSRAGRALAKRHSSQAGRALADCRWGKKKAKKPASKKKSAPKKAAAPPRRSRRHAGLAPETVRQPEPKKKPRKKAAKTKVSKSSARLKKIENILVPGLNAPKGDMKSFIEQQRRMYAP